MRHIYLVFFISILFVGCSGDDDMETVTPIVEEMIEEEVLETTFSEGVFMSGAHPTSGTVSVNSNKSILSFINFKTDDGPKLLVYLSTDINASEYVSLGDLKGIEGNYSYIIPANTDLLKYKYVNIWCVDFLVSFGTAELK